jgi:hypothetical protein
LPTCNFLQESNLDCGVAIFITCLRILGLHKLRIVDVYSKFLDHLDLCIVDLATELLNLGVRDFKLHSTRFEIADSDVGVLVDEAYSTYLKTLKANTVHLREQGNLIEGTTSLT